MTETGMERTAGARHRTALATVALVALGAVLLAPAGLATSTASGWSVEPTPDPGEGLGLYAVSCTSPSACIAVGGRGAPSITLAERWNGSRWSVQRTPSPARGGPEVYLNGVSCPSAGFCIAVGQINYSRGKTLTPHTLAERWDGRRWSLVHTPNPRRGEALFGVSCASKSACIAVGGGSYALRWNGKRWSLLRLPSQGILSGVWCTSPSACMAVGFESTTLAERWNGRRWSIERMPKLPYGGTLAKVTCRTSRQCTTVGTRQDTPAGGADWQTLVERWNGGRWSIERTPRLPEGRGYGNGLDGVSCASSSSCTAVGNTDRGDTLAEHWNGRRWSIQATPRVAHKGGLATLSGVSCPSIRTCTAVGIDTAVKTLAERWTR